MSTKSAENYLDELLNSVGAGKELKETVEQDNILEEDVLEQDDFMGQDGITEEDILATEYNEQREERYRADNFIRNTAKAEAEFLMEFEQELEGENFEDFLKEFDKEDIRLEDRLEELDMEFSDDDILAGMLGENFVQEPEPQVEEVPLEELPLEEHPLEGFSLGDFSADDFSTTTTEPIDLSQMGEEDLISLLAGAEDLADIGQLFEKNDNNLSVEGADPFAVFAENEMAEVEEEIEIIKQEEKPEKKSGKKLGFIEKLSALLFGKDEAAQEAAEKVSFSADDLPSVVELSDENADILSLFAEVDSSKTTESAQPAKGKKKDKKEKKKKEEKPKAPKKPMAPKPKKEKKPKVKDNTPPLPKGPVALVCLLAVSIFILVFFGTEWISYSSALSKAKELYKTGQYTEAAAAIAGMTIKEEDMMIKGQISTLATVHSQLSEYNVFMKNDKKAEALDSLISAAGRCDLNEDNALTFDCIDEMQVMQHKITKELEGFEMTYEQALKLYALTQRDRAEYTRELYKIYEKLGLIED